MFEFNDEFTDGFRNQVEPFLRDVKEEGITDFLVVCDKPTTRAGCYQRLFGRYICRPRRSINFFSELSTFENWCRYEVVGRKED